MNADHEISKTIASLIAIMFAFLGTFGLLGNTYASQKGSTITYTSWQEDVNTLLSMCDGDPLTACKGECSH